MNPNSGLIPVDYDAYSKALELCSVRGRDSTGLYTPETGIHKLDIPSPEFTKKFADVIKIAVKSRVLLSHCRAATQGTEKENKNNHPHESPNYILVHNGTVYSSDSIKSYKYNSDCDSEKILSYVETHGIKSGLSELRESDSIAMILYEKNTGKVYLFRNSNPTSLVIDKKEKIIYIASTFAILEPFIRKSPTLGFELWDELSVLETDRDVLYTFDATGLLKTDKIKQKSYVYGFRGHSMRSVSCTDYNDYENNWWCSSCGKYHNTITDCNLNKPSTKALPPKTDSSNVNKNDKTTKTVVRREIVYSNGHPQIKMFNLSGVGDD
jgi:hypothetical protein